MQPHIPFSYGAGAGGEAGTSPLTLAKEAKRRGDVLQQSLQQLQQPLHQQGREAGTNPLTLTKQTYREVAKSVDSDGVDGWEREGCQNRSKEQTHPSAAASLAQLKGTRLLSILFSFKTLSRAPKADTDARTEMNVGQHTSADVSRRQHGLRRHIDSNTRVVCLQEFLQNRHRLLETRRASQLKRISPQA
jgi:hypothetical protein